VRSLDSIYMRGCKMADVGMKAFMEALGEPKTNPNAVEGAGFPSLQCLHFNDNKIGDEGCLALADGIENGHMAKARLFQMGGNVQTRDGFEVVTEVLEEYELRRKISVHF